MTDKLIIRSKRYKGSSSVISARLPNELIEALDRMAQQTGRTRNELIQTCLEFSLDKAEVRPAGEEDTTNEE